MNKREFITLLGGAAAEWPLAARAQPVKLPIIGLLGASTPSVMGPWTASFVQRLRELGWIEGRTIAIEVHWAEGRNERYTEIAAEFVRLKVAVIVTSSAAPVLAAKQATSVIPIVFAAAVDPLGSQLVEFAGAPGRQHYRLVASTDRCCWQATGTLARGCTGSRPVGDHGQRR